MAVTLNSYITDLDELFLYANQNVVQRLASIGAESAEAALSGARLDRVYTALNAAKAFIDSALQFIYSVPFTATQATSATWPSSTVKRWTVEYMLYHLYCFHADRREQAAVLLSDLHDDIRRYTESGGLTLDLHGRTAQSGVQIIGGKETTGSLYDQAGQFPASIVKDDERGNFRSDY